MKELGHNGSRFLAVMELPSSEQIDAYYKEWFTANYMAPCGKTPPAVLAFSLAMLEKFIAPQFKED